MRIGTVPRSNVALSLASVLVTLVVVAAVYEVVAHVRYYRWRASFDNEGWIGRLTRASSNPVLLWEYHPNAEADGIATNRFGFRERDMDSPRKPPGTHRVAFLGDSVTLGMGVPPSETFVARVGALSQESRQPLETLNFGVDGYNALQIQELLLTRVLEFEPDTVVYVMCLNDFDFVDSSGRKTAYFRKPPSFLLLDLSRRWRSLRGTEFHRHHFEKTHDRVFRAVSEMQEALARQGIRLFVFLIPVFPDPPDHPGYFARYPLRAVHEDVRSEAAAHGLTVHDLLGVFEREDPPRDRYSLDVWHLDEGGHRVVARAIATELAVALGEGSPR